MDNVHTIQELGARLLKVDMLLMSLLHRRLNLALEVEQCKARDPDAERRKIFNPQREAERLQGVHDWAEAHGMNPHFARSVMYLAINESCKQQMIQMQNRADNKVFGARNEEEWRETLRRNLLVLTELWSGSYDTQYENAFFATRAYRDFEDSVLAEEMAKLPSKAVLLDLGCATGKLSLKLAEKFNQTVGYDISSHMIQVANSKLADSNPHNVAFKVADLEDGIPEPDASVSFVVMNLGTASDIRGISKVIKEIGRVLKPRGRFLLSFYNREALLYNWDFIPWQSGLAAMVNTYKDCLDVQVGAQTLSVYARPYSINEVADLVQGRVAVSEISTYPTISPLLPSELFEKQVEVQKAVASMDVQLAGETRGAYIIATGSKIK